MLRRHIGHSPTADDPFVGDRLERRHLVEVLARLVATIDQPFVISVHGQYGTGKTTFLQMLRGHMESRRHYCIYFDAWRSDFASDPLVALVGELEESLRRSPARDSGNVGSALRTMRKASGALMRRAIPLAVRMVTGGVVAVSTDDLADAFAEAAGESALKIAEEELAKYEAGRNSIESFRGALGEVAAALGTDESPYRTPLVVIIDELDRCRPTFAVELLERVKHLFSVPGVVFVLGVDREQLRESVRAVYGQGVDADGYVRRFIDLPYTLPAPDVGSYAHHLWESFGLPAFLSDRAQSQYVATTPAAIAEIAALFPLTLRALEQAFTELNVVMRATPPRLRADYQLVWFLLLLRTHEADLYRAYVSGRKNGNDVFDWVLNQSPQLLAAQTLDRLEVSLVVFSRDEAETTGRSQAWQRSEGDTAKGWRAARKLEMMFNSYGGHQGTAITEWDRHLALADAVIEGG